MKQNNYISNPVSRVKPNLGNYEQDRSRFSWATAMNELSGLPGGKGLNIAYEAVDRHAKGALADHIALRWLGENGTSKEFSYRNLKQMTDRFANVLKGLEIKKGDVVSTLTGRIPELYITALGTLKNGSVYCPLFSVYGPEPILQRLNKGKVKVLVTTKELFEKKVADLLDRLEYLEFILLVDTTVMSYDVIRSFHALLDEANDEFEIKPTKPEDIALLHFTSGTTGMPKGVLHVHQAAVVHYITGKYVLDFHPKDVFWCTADPGWVTGTSYGILAPLMHGITNLVVQAEFDASLWYEVLEQQKVTVWYTAPTAVRRLMRMNIDVRKEYDLSSLRLILSVGEPLNPEAVRWSLKTLGMPILDNWWQTETGGIMIANYPSMPVKPGSMGKPLPGVEAAIVATEEHDTSLNIISKADETGQLALKSGWPSMFRGYLDEKERYEQCFSGDWYLTGDLARRDEDGYYWFVGRADDIIKTAGHRVGPFEVESALMEHPAVAEVAVVGKPDPVMGEMVKAFIALKTGYSPSEELGLDILALGRKQLGPAVAPREIAFMEDLPKTKSGKILRRLLRDHESEILAHKMRSDGKY